MKNTNIISAVFALSVLLSVGLGCKQSEPIFHNGKEVIQVNGDTLALAFYKEIGTNRDYEDKLLLTNGALSSFDESSNELKLELNMRYYNYDKRNSYRAVPELLYITCQLKDSERSKLSRLELGYIVNIVGIGRRDGARNVLIEDCEIKLKNH